MKYLALTIVLGASIFALVAHVLAGTAPKGEKGVLVGEVVDIATYATKGLGEENVAAFKNRAELGFPVGIIEEETGRVYICVYRNPAPASGLETANDALAPYMGMKVAAQGLKYHAKGVNLLQLGVISEY